MEISAKELAEQLAKLLVSADEENDYNLSHGNGRFASLNVRLANGQEFRVQIEELS